MNCELNFSTKTNKLSIFIQSLYSKHKKIFIIFNRTKFFELSNHLGNVLATVSDKKIAISGTGISSTISHYIADVISATDYSPFGMSLVGRTYNSNKYRLGFNACSEHVELLAVN